MLLWSFCRPTHTYPDLFWSTAGVSMCSVMRVNNDISMQCVYSLLNSIWSIRMEHQDYVATQSLQPGSFQHPSLQFLLYWGQCSAAARAKMIDASATNQIPAWPRKDEWIVWSTNPNGCGTQIHMSLCAVWGRAQLPLGHNEVKIALTRGNIPELCQKWN